MARRRWICPQTARRDPKKIILFGRSLGTAVGRRWQTRFEKPGTYLRKSFFVDPRMPVSFFHSTIGPYPDPYDVQEKIRKSEHLCWSCTATRRSRAVHAGVRWFRCGRRAESFYDCRRRTTIRISSAAERYFIQLQNFMTDIFNPPLECRCLFARTKSRPTASVILVERLTAKARRLHRHFSVLRNHALSVEIRAVGQSCERIMLPKRSGSL